MSEIVSKTENHDDVEIICCDCLGNNPKTIAPSTGTSKRKFFVKWFYKCTNCPYQSKTYITNIKEFNNVT